MRQLRVTKPDTHASPSTKETHFSREARIAFAARAEQVTVACDMCGHPALYRVYTRGGVNLGACRMHVEAVKAKTPYFGGY